MKNSQDADVNPWTRILLVGKTGAGKTTQMWSLPGKKFAYIFDPNSMKSLKGLDMDYEEFYPDLLELDATLKGFNKGAKDDTLASKREPTVYLDWVDDVNEKAEKNFFNSYDWLCFDSGTFLTKAIMARQLFINGRYGSIALPYERGAPQQFLAFAQTLLLPSLHLPLPRPLAVAKKFGIGSKYSVAAGQGGKTQTDYLADVLARGEDTDVLEGISRLVPKETFQETASTLLDKKMSSAFVRAGPAGEKRLDIDMLSRSLGLDNPTGNKFKFTQRLLEEAGGLNIEQVQKLVEAGRAIEKVDIPSVSTFLARRTVFGGVRSLVNTMKGGLILGGGASAAAASGPGIMATTMFLGGTNLLGAMLTNPASAKLLSVALDKEVRTVVRRGAYVRALRLSLSSLQQQGVKLQGALSAAGLGSLGESMMEEFDKESE